MGLFENCRCRYCRRLFLDSNLLVELILYVEKGLKLKKTVTLEMVEQSFVLLEKYFHYANYKLPYILLYHLDCRFNVNSLKPLFSYKYGAK